jgi:hypothetical protein
MISSCSVRQCSKMSRWHFGHINLCQEHWEEWCHSTWQALVSNLQQPIMEDWVVGAETGQAANAFVIDQQLLRREYPAWPLG